MYCPSCGKEVATDASFCASCGKNLNESPLAQPQSPELKITHPQKSKATVWGTIFAALFGFWVIGKCSSYEPPSSKSRSASASETASTRSWTYSESTDKMTSSKTKTAFLQSTNEVEFKFPYSEKQRMILVVRKKGSLDSMIKIERGQFMCHVTEECHVKIRFDEGKAERFQVGLPSDHSSTVLFFENPSRLIQKLKKAKKVLIETTIYQEGNIVFEFNYDSFEWK